MEDGEGDSAGGRELDDPPRPLASPGYGEGAVVSPYCRW